ncbi:MAG: S-layer homology domain-containing protein [Bacillota bacterium]
MVKRRIMAVMICIFMLMHPIFAAGLGDNPPQLPNEPDIVSVQLSSSSHVSGTVGSTSVTVDTSNVTDGTSISAQLVENDGSTPINGVNAASGIMEDDTENLTLTIPAGIAAGSYKIKVSLASLNLSDTTTIYTITSGGQSGIVSVIPSVSGHVSGTQQTVLVDLETVNVSNETMATVQLVNSSGSVVNGVTAATAKVNNNIADNISLVIPSSVSAGTYYIKVMVSAVSDATTVYTITSQSNDPAVTSVSLSSFSQNEGTSAAVTVTVNTNLVNDGTAVTVSLVDTSYNVIADVSDVAANIVNNTATAELTIPSTVNVGSYYVKAMIDSLDPKYSQAYSVKVPSPTITSISTTGATLIAGSTSGNIIVNGTNFSSTAGNNAVSILNSSTSEVVSTTIPSSASTTSMAIPVPSNLTIGTYKVKVTVNGKSVTSSSTFTVIGLPTITSVSTAAANLVEGSISGNMVIYGTNFSAAVTDNSVYIINNATGQTVGSAITPSSASTASLTAAVPTGLPAGTYKVRVTVGGNSVTSSGTFTVVAASDDLPTITSISTAGASLEEGAISGNIVITGTNFSETAADNGVYIINNATAQIIGSAVTPSLASATSLTAAIPTGLSAGTYKVRVTVGGNSVTSSGTFTITTAAGSGGGGGGGGAVPESPQTTTTNADGSQTVVDSANNKAITEYTGELIASKAGNSNLVIIELPDVSVAAQEIVLNNDAVKSIVAGNLDVSIIIGKAKLEIPSTLFADYADRSLNVEIRTIENEEKNSLLSATTDRNMFITGSVVEFTINAVTGSTQQSVTNFKSRVKMELSLTGANMSGVDTRKLGIYYLEEPAMVWRYLGGKYNTQTGKMEVETDHFTKFAVMEYKKTFADVPQGNWAKDYIELLAAKHITSGVDANNFDPKGIVTRAQFTTFLVKALNIDLDSYKGMFSDVPQGKWFTLYIEAAAKAGLVNGVGEGKFNPDGTITRQEMAVMVMNAYKYVTGKRIVDEAQKSTAVFKDSDEISSWAKDSVLAAQANGIINGTPQNTFEPKGNAQRDAAATVIIKLLEAADAL